MLVSRPWQNPRQPSGGGRARVHHLSKREAFRWLMVNFATNQAQWDLWPVTREHRERSAVAVLVGMSAGVRQESLLFFGANRATVFFFVDKRVPKQRVKSVPSQLTGHAETATYHRPPLSTWRPAEIRKNFSTRRGGAVSPRVAPTIQQMQTPWLRHKPKWTQDWRARGRNGSGMSESSPWRGDGKSVRFQSNVRRSPLRARPAWLVHCPPPTPDRFAPCGVELPPELRHKPLHTVGEVPHLRGEERREWYRWPIAQREKQEVPRRSPQCVVDPGRGCQPVPDPARTHSSKLLLPPRDTRAAADSNA